MFIFTSQASKGFLSSLQSPEGAGTQLQALLFPSLLSPCSDRVLLIMKWNKREAGSIEHATDAEIKAEVN